MTARVPYAGHRYHRRPGPVRRDAPLRRNAVVRGDGDGTEPRRNGHVRRSTVAFDPDTVERDLVKLVLTVVELLRQLMERQALRRVDAGDLTEDQEERVGLTLMLLDERMGELRERYGLRPEDLNLDLGPLGPLLPRE